MRAPYSFVALYLLALVPLQAKESVAEIGYLEPSVEIFRGGETLSFEALAPGNSVENYDILRTDATGIAEIQLKAARAPQSIIKISPQTTFSFELAIVEGSQITSIEMVSGNLSLKMGKLRGDQRFEVRTEDAVLGVRGTSFEVASSINGEILVTCDEGEVSCETEDGAILSSTPGSAVEKSPGELFRQVPVAVSDLKAFRERWQAERLEAFKANALRAIRAYVLRYQKLKEEFRAAFQGLQRERQILNKWLQEDRQGTIGTRMEIFREKKALIGHLLKIRRLLFLFERIYFRLLELKGYYDQGYGEGQVQPGLSSAEFFRRFDQERRELARMMAQVRTVIKLYAKRNEGTFPTEGFGD